MSVTVYSKPGCMQCKATIKALDRAGVAHTVIDVTDDDAARNHLLRMGIQQMPVVETDTERWSGFRPDRVAALATASEQAQSA